MIPLLESGVLIDAARGGGWRRCGRSRGQLWNLATALLEGAGLGPETHDRPETGLLLATLRRGRLGLLEALVDPSWARAEGAAEDHDGDSSPYRDANLLLVVDQFEEVLRFRDDGGQDESEAFVELLLASVRQNDLPVHVVLTMRTDFLGPCTRFPGLPEMLNKGQFLTPELDRDRLREVIEGPARVFEREIDPALVNRLLNDLGDLVPDRLPILQHALMRLWARTAGASAVQPIGVDSYEEIGKLTEALSQHASETFEALDSRGQAIAKVLFRNLVASAGEAEALSLVRSPVKLGKVCALAQAGEAEVVAVVEHFRADGRSFLLPPPTVPLSKESTIDITHESLIRQWAWLDAWAREKEHAFRIARLQAEPFATPTNAVPPPHTAVMNDLGIYIVHDPADAAWAAAFADQLFAVIAPEFATDEGPGIEAWSGLENLPDPEAIGPLSLVLLVLPDAARGFAPGEQRKLEDFRRESRDDQSTRLVPISREAARDRPPHPIGDTVSFRLHDASDPSSIQRLKTMVLIRLGLRVSSANRSLYISYRKQDGFEWAAAIGNGLEGRGYSVWRDESSDRDSVSPIVPGSITQETIRKSIRSRGLILVIDTSEAPASMWVQAEIETAFTEMLPILPVVIEDPIGTARQRLAVPPPGGRFRVLRELSREVRITIQRMTASAGSTGRALDVLDDHFFESLEDQICGLLLAHLRSRRRLIRETRERFLRLGYSWGVISESQLLFRAEIDRSSDERPWRSEIDLASDVTPWLSMRLLVQCAPYEVSLEELIRFLLDAYHRMTEPYQYCVLVHQMPLYPKEKQRLLRSAGGLVQLLQPDEIETMTFSQLAPGVPLAGELKHSRPEDSAPGVVTIDRGRREVAFLDPEGRQHVLQWDLPIPTPQVLAATSDMSPWLKLSSLLVRQYTTLRPLIADIVRIGAAAKTNDSYFYQRRAADFVWDLRPVLHSIQVEFEMLPVPLARSPMIRQLMEIGSCLMAVRRGLSSPKGSANLVASLGLVERIESWLLDAIGIANHALETLITPAADD